MPEVRAGGSAAVLGSKDRTASQIKYPGKAGALVYAPLSGRSRFEAPFVCQRTKYYLGMPPTTINFSATFGAQLSVIPTSLLCGLRFQVVHRQTSSCVVARIRSFAMGDRRKCQTYAAPRQSRGSPGYSRLQLTAAATVQLTLPGFRPEPFCGWRALEVRPLPPAQVCKTSPVSASPNAGAVSFKH